MRCSPYLYIIQLILRRAQKRVNSGGEIRCGHDLHGGPTFADLLAVFHLPEFPVFILVDYLRIGKQK